MKTPRGAAQQSKKADESSGRRNGTEPTPRTGGDRGIRSANAWHDALPASECVSTSESVCGEERTRAERSSASSAPMPAERSRPLCGGVCGIRRAGTTRPKRRVRSTRKSCGANRGPILGKVAVFRFASLKSKKRCRRRAQSSSGPIPEAGNVPRKERGTQYCPRARNDPIRWVPGPSRRGHTARSACRKTASWRLNQNSCTHPPSFSYRYKRANVKHVSHHPRSARIPHRNLYLEDSSRRPSRCTTLLRSLNRSIPFRAPSPVRAQAGEAPRFIKECACRKAWKGSRCLAGSACFHA